MLRAFLVNVFSLRPRKERKLTQSTSITNPKGITVILQFTGWPYNFSQKLKTHFKRKYYRLLNDELQ